MEQPILSLDKKIGSGSFGDVFLGHMRNTGEKVAVKRVKKSILKKHGNYLIEAFWKEINSMKICECENSVRLIKTMETENNYNIIMELCDSDLLNFLNKSPTPFTVDEVRETFSQLNNVFKIMHQHNIIHRDLKLANILIKYTDETQKKFIPKLSDYGFSKDLNNSNYTETHLGTPATMAPEIMMNKPYNEKSDIWSIGAMMYQLHFKRIPYPGFCEQQILNKIKTGYARKDPSDPQFKDLLDKIFVMDPVQRISWDAYFNHPFFINEKEKKIQYEKISDFDLGYDYNIKEKDLFYCYIAKDKKTEKNVLIKSYREDLIDKYKDLFAKELDLFEKFKTNQRVLKLIETNKENNRFNMVFENIEAQSLINYKKNNDINENNIKIFNKILYYEIFMFNESNLLPFSFISVHSFLRDRALSPIIFDFGIHQIFLPEDEYSSYFLPNTSEKENSSPDKIKTNVMNYGITLIKMFSKQNFNIQGKEIVLPEDIIMSEDFLDFMMKCLKRNINKRASWKELGKCGFIVKNIPLKASYSEIVPDEKCLIDEDKLLKIFDYLNEKFDLIYNYYNKIDLKNNPNISQIDIFVSVTLFEMKIINLFFNRKNEYEEFSNKQEISFMSINSNYEMNKCDLNFVNPYIKDIEILNLEDNKLRIKDFLINLQKNIKKIEKLLIKIQSYNKSSSCLGDYEKFLKNILSSINNKESGMQKYFSKLIEITSKEKNEELKYMEIYITKYLMEFILFMICFINERGEKIIFNSDKLLVKFYKIFGEEKNKIEISTIDVGEKVNNYFFISFLPIIFKVKESEIDDQIKMSKDKQSLNGWIKYYLNLMRTISGLKKK